eukprot:scaffold2713_cov402-Prasinococcus_capsulatus_cf.AAC.2
MASNEARAAGHEHTLPLPTGRARNYAHTPCPPVGCACASLARPRQTLFSTAVEIGGSAVAAAVKLPSPYCACTPSCQGRRLQVQAMPHKHSVLSRGHLHEASSGQDRDSCSARKSQKGHWRGSPVQPSLK